MNLQPKTLFILTSALLAACSGGSSAPLSLSVRAGTSTIAARSTSLAAGTGIDLQRIRLVVSTLKLENAEGVELEHQEGDDHVGSGRHHDGEVDVAAGPFFVDLATTALTGAVQHVFDASVPAGTYGELKFEVKPLAQAPAGADAGLVDMVGKKASLIVDGTIDGQTFTFVSALAAVQKTEGSFTAAATSNNITLQIDPAGWFTAADKSRLDPRLETARAAIEANITRSMKSFQDDDRSGHENHHGHDGADGGENHDGGGH